MTNQAVDTQSAQNETFRRNGSEEDRLAQPIVVRLDSVPVTADSRRRILERVDRLNRSLEDSGTPFRLRLL